MSKHPRDVENFAGSLEQLAQDVGNLEYDVTQRFIILLADDLKRQGDADLARPKPRPKLATDLYATAERLYEAAESMESAWETCEPYMNK